MKITFLGTGTSQGVPVIGCTCEVCQSTDPKDNRLRTAVLISKGSVNIAVDCGPDFRQQMLRAKVDHLNAVLITHEHNDHVIGMDDVRPFNFSSGIDMPIYATEDVQEKIKARFSYVFSSNPYPGAPRLKLNTIQKDKPFWVSGIKVNPIEIIHGRLPILGFRFGDFTYITDAKTITAGEMEKLKGTKVLVLNALHHNVHHSHLNLSEALEWIEKIAPEKAYLLHLSHKMGKHKEVSEQLPFNVELAYDGLTITCAE
ncbi:MAG: MBL fold metallo-hydrolase [Saprospiraceae bacterium]